MQIINQYQINELFYEVNERIKHWFCQDAKGVKYELLTIQRTKETAFILKCLFKYELPPLVNQSIEGIQNIQAIGFDEHEQCYFIVYEYLEGFVRLSSGRSMTSFQNLLDLAKGLESLQAKQYTTQIISPNTIRINSEGRAVLSYVGLWDLFRKEEVLPERQLSPDTQAFLKSNQNDVASRPSHQDNVYALIKSFESFLKKEQKQMVVGAILQRGLFPQRADYLSSYSELIELLEQVSFKMPYDEKRRAIRVIVNRKAIDANTLRLLLKEMNQEVCLDLAHQRSDRGLITGRFSTANWNGKFVLNNDKSLFIPHCNNERNNRVWDAPYSFVLKASFSEYPSNYNCIPFFTQKFETQNDLLKLQRKQKSLVRAWKLLPEKELQQLEQNAFQVNYKHRTQDAEGRLVFRLSETSISTWVRVAAIHQQSIGLCVERQLVGRLVDYDKIQKTIVLGDIHCLLEEIPKKGILKEDLRQESSQLRKQLEALQNFEASKIVNPLLCRILARPEVNAFVENQPLQEENYQAFSKTLFNPNLRNDRTQAEAVLEALNRQPLYLIQGPPGTGKTTVIIELLQQILQREKEAKILVTSQSNLAVDNVLEGILKINKRTQNSLPFMRLASKYTLNKSAIPTEIMAHTYEHKLQQWIQEKEQKSVDYIKGCSPSEQKQLKAIQQRWFAFLNGANVDLANGKKQAMVQTGHGAVDFLSALLQEVSIVGATCMHIASGQYQHMNLEFDYVIMDESSKATPSETLVPINMGRNIILIGDHQQLPPVVAKDRVLKGALKKTLVDNGLGEDRDFGKSLFETLIEAFERDEKQKAHIKMLAVQYRMPAQIGSLISKYFYKNTLQNAAPELLKHTQHGLNLKKDTSIVFINTSNRSNPSDNGDSVHRSNACNVTVITELLTQLNTLYVGNKEQEKPLSIGVIAGYNGQVKLLRKAIDQKNYENFEALISVDTVDKFQGAERDIIIYDIVRSSPQKKDVIGFLEDHRRINVAFSRVKRLLFIVGDKDYLLNRAILHPQSAVKIFKLQQIVQALDKEGLVYDDFSDLLEKDF